MKKIRINELARELEVKPNRIIDLLPEFGVVEKKTHSSSIDEDVAEKIKRRLLGEEESYPGIEAAAPAGSEERGLFDPIPAMEAPSAPPFPPVMAPLAGMGMPVVEEAPAGAPEEEAALLGRPVRPPLGRGGPVHPPILQPGVTRPPTPPAAPPPVAPPAGVVAPGPKPGTIQAKPLPAVPRPGQILSGPRQPLPVAQSEAVAVSPGAPRAAAIPRLPVSRAPVQPATTAGAQAPAARATPAAGGARALAGQPAARPVVPPRPDLVARLQQTQPMKAMPGQPQARGPVPGRPQSTPVPGQPIYRGPIRPGQSVMRAGGAATPAGRIARGRAMHPTSTLRIEPVPIPTEASRREAGKRGRAVREREEEEGRLRAPVRRQQPEGPPPVDREITISEGVTVKELSEKLGVKANMVIKKLVERKIFATINQTLEVKLAEDVARDFGASTNKISFEEEATQEIELAEDSRDRTRRPPVVTIMGHVDHGKTSLLDAIRSSHIVDREAGGITQHIGAYYVEHNGQKIVFIDTPGHEAFTRMRARGAKVTDIVVLVVAADDGVMPQTLEAIDHARAAQVPIVVAINKIDKPDAQPERIKQQLSDRGLLAEDWGGDVVMVPVSAKTKTNIDLLLEMILLVAEMADLKANPERPSVGTVLEQELDRGRGPVATVLVQNGTLNVGDYFICGAVFGKVRAMFDDRGLPLKQAGPSMPVEVLGLESLPEVGDTFQVVTDTAKAKQIVIYRESKAREQAMVKSARISLDQLHEQLREGETKELPIILKTDVGGTAEVLSDTLQKLSNEKVKVRVLHSGVGAINETDVLLASASNAIIVGFNVRPERNASNLSEQEKVDIRLHTIIYELTDEMKRAMTGMLAPVFKEAYKGRAEVREVFHISKVGTVAGCMVVDGVLTRDSQVRLLRDNVVIHTGKLESLKRFKNDASEVKSGFECGAALANYSDLKPGDVIEAFVMERVSAEVMV